MNLWTSSVIPVGIIYLCFCFNTLETAPAVQSTLQAMSYLTRFGYMESSSRSSNLLTEAALNGAIKEFQRFAGLNQTGSLDNETVVMMNTPRCGVKDKVGHGNNARRKRYALQGSRWRSKELTYRISKYPSGTIAKDDVDNEIRKSFDIWSEVTDLKFTQTYDKAHIEIRFEKFEHGDGDPFDGPGGTLAHAYFPIYGGDAHFDDSERWTINSYRGTNLFIVASHEFGHTLGLSHSDVKSSLMAPFYKRYEPNMKLHKDDVLGIQTLYGPKTKESPHRRPSYNPSMGYQPSSYPDDHEEGELCSDSSIDAIFLMGKETIAFKGEYYWVLTDTGLADGYPRSITKDFKGLPSRMDAAFSWRNGKTYFFKGDQYWRFTGKVMDKDYPQKIKDGFPGIPDNIDAALVWSGNGKIYFFKDALYWRFDPEQLPPVSEDYPKSIGNWDGIPAGINAAFQWTNGYTYFFKGTYYWRFNDRTFAVDTARPPFPRSSAIWWFGCKSMQADDDPLAGLLATSTNKNNPGVAQSLSSDGKSYLYGARDDVEFYQPDGEMSDSIKEASGCNASTPSVIILFSIAIIFSIQRFLSSAYTTC
ncbi:S-methylmethionine permease mmp1 [Chamberlinius hualienensis]